eukprot:scaffold17945_cov149-Skeletonema_marinoi.AAC.2
MNGATTVKLWLRFKEDVKECPQVDSPRTIEECSCHKNNHGRRRVGGAADHDKGGRKSVDSATEYYL